MKLYFAPGTCAHSPHIALREAGLPFELVRVDLKTKRTSDGRDYLTINPYGYVPALELDDGTILTEGPAIVQYIADQAPTSGLAPANGTIARYQLQSLLGLINSEIHKGFSPLFKPDTPDATKAAAKAHLASRIGELAKRLDKQDYLAGNQFTVADGYLYTVLGWGPFVDVDINRWPSITAFMTRVAARPTVQAARAAEGLTQ
ncbi:MAG: glutathione transferase GstA [Rhodocyclales bacterium]|nr:glutathione transferase GstA [Rhodocyclales bacterium]